VSDTQDSGGTVEVGAAEWMAPGRRTVDGYLLVMRGARKRESKSLLGMILESALEADGHQFPRYPDCHAVWFGYDPDGPPRNRHRRPFLRYKATRPIDGLSAEHNGHRVRLTASIGKPWVNGVGAYITRATGHCLECSQSGRPQ
jgi:hypothetical protein